MVESAAGRSRETLVELQSLRDHDHVDLPVRRQIGHRRRDQEASVRHEQVPGRELFRQLAVRRPELDVRIELGTVALKTQQRGTPTHGEDQPEHRCRASAARQPGRDEKRQHCRLGEQIPDLRGRFEERPRRDMPRETENHDARDVPSSPRQHHSLAVLAQYLNCSTVSRRCVSAPSGVSSLITAVRRYSTVFSHICV
jgi:hypothetical protein